MGRSDAVGPVNGGQPSEWRAIYPGPVREERSIWFSPGSLA